MTNIYLRYRNSTGDAWTTVPSLTSAFPNLASGALPGSCITLASGPLTETPCGCPDDSTDDLYLILRTDCVPIPIASEAAIITFLMRYKSATYYEAKMERYGQGGYITATLSHIEAEERNGLLHLSFRLAAAMSGALTNT